MQNYNYPSVEEDKRQRIKNIYKQTYKKDFIRHKKLKSKKQNNGKIIFLALIFWSIILGGTAVLNIKNFIEPVYTNRLNNKNLNFDSKMIYAPTLNYATNLNLFGENLLAPIPKKKEKIQQINSTGELSLLKRYILTIMNNYKNLHAGVYVYDYNSGRTLEINSEEVFPAASIIKIPVLLDLFNRSKNLEKEGYEPLDTEKKLTFTEAHRTEGSGNLQYRSADVDYSIDYLAKIMIQKSDNSATNMLIEEVGGINELNASLRHWGFSKTQVTSWLPDLSGTNTTTPKDIATMLYNIDNQKFVSLASGANIKEYMSKVENQTLMRSQIPNHVILMHKTGDIGKMLGDAGIVFTPTGKKFIMVVMVKRPHNHYGARELIQKITKAVYNTLG